MKASLAKVIDLATEGKLCGSTSDVLDEQDKTFKGITNWNKIFSKVYDCLSKEWFGLLLLNTS